MLDFSLAQHNTVFEEFLSPGIACKYGELLIPLAMWVLAILLIEGRQDSPPTQAPSIMPKFARNNRKKRLEQMYPTG
jgi:hypothetical protein